jgi:hypothetical protein
MERRHEHLISEVKNTRFRRWIAGRVVRRMNRSRSRYTLRLRYRRPIKGERYGPFGALRSVNATRFSVYLDTRPGERHAAATVRWAVAVGNAFDGLAFYGPFHTSTDANAWADLTGIVDDWWVVRMDDPKPIPGEG